MFHHLPLALASGVLVVLLTGLSPFGGGRVSTGQFVAATGSIATALLALTLLIGPINLLLRRRKPVSSYLRRDVGTWTAAVSTVHVILGFAAHGGDLASILGFFFVEGKPSTNSFGLGNWTGLLALVIVIGLLAISTDRSMRELKAKRWKNLQRLTYALFALVLLHAYFYGALTHMRFPLTPLLVLTIVAVIVGQTTGIWLWQRRRVHSVGQPESRAQAAAQQPWMAGRSLP